ncbi:PREDICTED: neuron navigator 2-like, partial [Chlamydotis macqueenii]|uniref:neuron navigator 2-like n=1 Tax=Chlamydotis macqueenii TaxID=187382 RepID=UPI000529DE76
IYTDWANHYLAKSGHKRLIKDLQQDVTDGVLLAEIIQVVANEKIEDINGCPKNKSQMIENIDACLSFLAAKGINIQGLSAEEIRNGNLKAILGLFFSLSRYKQQQQQPQKQQPQHHLSQQPPPVSQQAGPPSQCQVGVPQQQVPALLQTPCQQPPQAAQHQFKAQPEMQSRLPGPTTRVSAAGSEAKARGSISANNRRSQSFNNYDKSKPGLPPPAPTSSNDKGIYRDSVQRRSLNVKAKAFSGCRYRGGYRDSYGSGAEASDSVPVALSQLDSGLAEGYWDG